MSRAAYSLGVMRGAPVRVLMVTADFLPAWSGIGVTVEAQARALQRLGAHVEVLWVSPAASAGVASAVPVHRQTFRGCAVDPSAFDVVHLHSLALAELATEMCDRYRMPLVYTSHSVVDRELASAPARPFWCDVQRYLFRRAERVVFVSHAERRLALEAHPQLGERAAVVHNGVDDPPAMAPKRTEEFGPLLFVGRFAPSKGLALLEAILTRLEERGRYEIIIAGGHGCASSDAIVARLANALGNRCRVQGWSGAAQLEALYAGAGLLLVTSEYEPFGLVALEAMRFGCPVLARAVGGLAETVTLGSGGLLMESNCPEHWAEAIVALASDAARRSELSGRGPRHVRRMFTNAKAAARLLSQVYAPVRGESSIALRARAHASAGDTRVRPPGDGASSRGSVIHGS